MTLGSYLLKKEKNKWTTIDVNGRPPAPRYSHSMNYFESNNMLVIFGGRIQSQIHNQTFSLNDVWILELRKVEWFRLNCSGNMPTKRYGHISLLNGNQLVVFGGLTDDMFCDNTLHVLKIDPGFTKRYK